MNFKFQVTPTARNNWGVRCKRMKWFSAILLVLSGLGPPLSATTRRVTDYGAVPDDGGDDRAAINSAIASALPGDTVYFPVGTYRVSGSILAKSGIRLEGTNTNGSVLLYVGAAKDVILTLNNSSNVVVSHLALDGGNSALVNQGISAANGSTHSERSSSATCSTSQRTAGQTW